MDFLSIPAIDVAIPARGSAQHEESVHWEQRAGEQEGAATPAS